MLGWNSVRIFRVKSLKDLDNTANKLDKVNAFYYHSRLLWLYVIPPNDGFDRKLRKELRKQIFQERTNNALNHPSCGQHCSMIFLRLSDVFRPINCLVSIYKCGNLKAFNTTPEISVGRAPLGLSIDSGCRRGNKGKVTAQILDWNTWIETWFTTYHLCDSGKLLNPSVPQFPLLKNGGNGSTHIIGL